MDRGRLHLPSLERNYEAGDHQNGPISTKEPVLVLDPGLGSYDSPLIILGLCISYFYFNVKRIANKYGCCKPDFVHTVKSDKGRRRHDISKTKSLGASKC